MNYPEQVTLFQIEKVETFHVLTSWSELPFIEVTSLDVNEVSL